MYNKLAAIAYLSFSKLKTKLGLSLAAQLYSQITTIAIQLMMVPILLYLWGPETYSSWLILSAVPTYLTFSDFGLTFVAKNEIVMATAIGSRDHAVKVYQTVFLILTMIVPMIGISAIIFSHLVNWQQYIGLHNLAASEARSTLILLVINVLMYQFFLLGCAGIRSENRPATETLVSATARVAESISIIIAALVVGKSLATAAAAMLGIRLIFIIGTFSWLRIASPWLRLGWSFASKDVAKRIIGPSTAYMLMPVAQATLLQAPIIILAATGGAISVVIFSTTRTLTRLGTAFSNLINNALVTEYSILKAREDLSGWRHLLSWHLKIAGVASSCYFLALLIVGDKLMLLFTHHRVGAVLPFFYFMTGAVAAEMIWSAIFTPLSAINKHRNAIIGVLILSLVGILTSVFTSKAFGLAGIAFTLMIVHVLILVICSIILKRESSLLAVGVRNVSEEPGCVGGRLKT